jgi:hypothetical protein
VILTRIFLWYQALPIASDFQKNGCVITRFKMSALQKSAEGTLGVRAVGDSNPFARFYLETNKGVARNNLAAPFLFFLGFAIIMLILC